MGLSNPNERNVWKVCRQSTPSLISPRAPAPTPNQHVQFSTSIYRLTASVVHSVVNYPPFPQGAAGAADRIFAMAARASWRQAQSAAPQKELLIIQHLSPPGGRTPLELDLLRPPRTTLVLQRQRVPTTGFHHQLLKMPAVPDGTLRLGSEFIRHVNRKTPSPLSAV